MPLISTTLEGQIEEEINKYTILPEFLHWALGALDEKNDTEIENRNKVYKMQKRTYNQIQKELEKLTKMRYRLLINDETYLKDKTEP